MDNETEYTQKVEETTIIGIENLKELPDGESIIPLKEEKPKRKPRAKKDTEETKQQIDKLLEQLEGNIQGRGNGEDIIKELKELAKQISIKKELNNGLDWISIAIGRKYYTEIYNRIGILRGKIKEL